MKDAIAVTLGGVADPAIKLPVAIGMQWLQIARAQMQDTPGLASMWRLAVKAAKHKQGRKWQAVRGPMAATIATLLDAGWEPEEWNQWADAHGQVWSLAEEGDNQINMRTCDSMLRAFRRDLQHQLWKQGSLQHLLQDKASWTAGQWLKLFRSKKVRRS